MNERAPNERHWAGFALAEQTSLRRNRLMRTILNTVVDYQLIEKDAHIKKK